jgi:hypothetical protein
MSWPSAFHHVRVITDAGRMAESDVSVCEGCQKVPVGSKRNKHHDQNHAGDNPKRPTRFHWAGHAAMLTVRIVM